MVLARRTLEAGGNLDGEVADPVARAVVHPHLRYVALTFLAGVVVLVVLAGIGRQRRWVGIACALSLVGLVFAQSGFMLRSHNPTIDPELVGPTSPGLNAVKEAAGPAEDTVSLGNLLAADANLWYRIRSPDTYDGVGVRRYEQLQRDVAAMAPELAGRRAMELFGVRLMAAEAAYPTALPAAAATTAPFSFTAAADGMHAVTVAAVPAAGEEDCTVTLELVDATDGDDVAASASAPCARPFTTLSFPPQEESGGRSYSARFGGSAEVQVMVPWWGGVPGLEQLPANDRVALFRAPGAPGRFFSPPEARPVASDDEARGVLTSAGFEVSRTVLLHGEGVEASTGTPGTVEVLEQRATEVRLRVTRDDPGWLVAVQTWFPGWEATVDGFPTELRRANHAFSAVPVDAGVHDVVLRYRPRSVLYGVVVSGAALVVLLMWAATARPGAPGEHRARIPWGPPRPPKHPVPPVQPAPPPTA